MTEEELMARLKQVGAMRRGDEIPDWFGQDWSGLPALCNTAANELELMRSVARLEKRRADDAEAELAERRWMPMETVPVPPWSSALPATYSFRCLVQLHSGWVCDAVAVYVHPPGPRRTGKSKILKWRANRFTVEPKFWQPLPLPKKD